MTESTHMTPVELYNEMVDLLYTGDRDAARVDAKRAIGLVVRYIAGSEAGDSVRAGYAAQIRYLLMNELLEAKVRKP